MNRNTAIVEETQRWTGRKQVWDCPNSERASDKEVLWLSQRVLLAEERDIYDVAHAVRKVVRHLQS
ncbi:hypothetical protein [Paenibacillus hemerocallicola]|uniref:hypothetical protein n=1 Tax=Paenibacillus hemerocallicola TaxID=1172614 RepID=UPI001FE7C929|nr:hypothetical protein [Paenibacillus hemerocallicola]